MARTPSASHTATSSSSASLSPETTVARGPLTVATESLPSQRTSSSRVFADGSATDTMPPRPDSAPRAWLRRATTRAASSSESAPATHAAAISPCELPTTAAGVTP